MPLSTELWPSSVTSLSSVRLVNIVGAPAILILLVPLVLAVSWCIYNVTLHPLRKYPGPKFWAASTLPWILCRLRGRLHLQLLRFHDQYGPIVRVAPNELSYIDDCWKTIYGHRTEEMTKSTTFAIPVPANGVAGIIQANRADHARQRRLLAHAFSEKALREQESYLQFYVDKLVTVLRQHCDKAPVDIVSWLNYTTFDLIGDLAFGQPFGCLDAGELHPWVKLVFSSLQQILTDASLRFYHLTSLKRFLVPVTLVTSRVEMQNHATQVVEKRLNTDIDRKDFLSYVLRHNDEKGMSRKELHTTSNSLILAGSDTTASALSGAFYNLLRNSDIYNKLATEVRSTFATDGEITMLAVNELKYLQVVIEESLRIFPPVATPLITRVTPLSGETIGGSFVPGGVRVGINQYAANHSSQNFHNPDAFIPERWLPENRQKGPYAGDKRSVMQPFSFGPRNCLGMNLAYAEMRLILAKLFFNFDFELEEEYKNWQAEQKTTFLWDKTPMMIRVIPVGH